MPTEPGPQETPTRGRALLSGAFVVLIVIGTWALIEYRTQPPPPPPLQAKADALAAPR